MKLPLEVVIKPVPETSCLPEGCGADPGLVAAKLQFLTGNEAVAYGDVSVLNVKQHLPEPNTHTSVQTRSLGETLWHGLKTHHKLNHLPRALLAYFLLPF